MIKLIPKKKESRSNEETNTQNKTTVSQQTMNDKIQKNIDKINKDNPVKNDNRPKPTFPNPVIRGVKKKYAEKGIQLIKRIQK